MFWYMYITYSNYKEAINNIGKKDCSSEDKKAMVIKSNIIKHFMTYIDVLRLLYTYDIF